MAMYPGIKNAMDKIAAGEGHPGRHPDPEHHHDAHGDDGRAGAGAKKRRARSRPAPAAVLGGMLGRFGQKKAEEPKDQDAARPRRGPGGRHQQHVHDGTTEELVSVVDVGVAPTTRCPAGFQQK